MWVEKQQKFTFSVFLQIQSDCPTLMPPSVPGCEFFTSELCHIHTPADRAGSPGFQTRFHAPGYQFDRDIGATAHPVALNARHKTNVQRQIRLVKVSIYIFSMFKSVLYIFVTGKTGRYTRC
jgi:hypothetical protein